MRALNIVTVLFSGGLLLAAGCGSSSDGSGEGGSGGHAGATAGSAGKGGNGGGAAGAAGHAGSGGGVAGATAGGSGSTNVGGATAGTAGTVAGAGGAAGLGGAAAGAGGAAAGAGGTAVAGAGGHAGSAGSGGAAAGVGGVAGAAGAAGGGIAGAGGAGGSSLSPLAARGQYLVTSVLGCTGCHTAQLGGTDCFAKSGATGCLSSANLTNDPTGLMGFSDQQIKDAITKGVSPRDPSKYLFSNMPYYQFAPLSDQDASAIVAYLRVVPGVSHTVQAATAPFDVRPTAPDWAPVDPAALPAASGAAGPANGKYLATLACVTCHTVNATGSPVHIDAAKAFQGGKVVTPTVNGVAKSVETANLTPHATGLMSWNVSQIAAAITTAKDKNGVAICGMRALANMTTSDAIDIGTYLLGIPAVANTLTMTCQ
jgi:hypothetical protein